MGYVERGRYLEDFTIGEEIFTSARTVTEADVCCFAGLSGDYNPLHTNEEFGKTTIFGKKIAHGMLGVAIITGLMNQLGIFEGTTIAFIESVDKFKGPLFIGDTVHTVVKILEIKKSSKPGRGILTLQANLMNQKDELVIEQTQVLMIKTRS